MPGPPRRGFTTFSLRTHLLIVVVATLLPTLGIAAVLVRRVVADDRQAVEQRRGTAGEGAGGPEHRRQLGSMKPPSLKAERTSSAAAAPASLNDSEPQNGPRSVCSDWFGG